MFDYERDCQIFAGKAWEVERHYQPLMSQCKTPDDLGAL